MSGKNTFDLKIVTGISGAGKTQVIQILEDLGFYCVDNLPPNLFVKFAELAEQSHSELEKVALVADVRGGRFFLDLINVLEDMKASGVNFEIIYLEASDDALVRRFKETRRKHPLSHTGSVLSGIREERKRLQTIRGMADIVIDTSDLKASVLKERIVKLVEGDDHQIRMSVSVYSFGFKYGMPIDVDLVMDVRFLPNPYYIEEMRTLTGLNAPVRDYVLNKEVTKNFLEKYSSLLIDILPKYIEEGKKHLSIGIGCTGGQHRSVAIADELGKILTAAQKSGKYGLDGIEIRTDHRDVEKSRMRTKYKPLND
ncbi:MAG: RNase adapter RapZ [Bacillota bacterium]